MFIGLLSGLSSGGSHGVAYNGSGYLGLAWSSSGVAHKGKGLIFVFQEFSASIGEAFILAGGLGAGLSFILWGMGTFLIFPSFVSLLLFGNSRGNSYMSRL